MVSTKALTFLALAASALAAPSPRRGHKKIVWHTVIETAYVTVPYGYETPKTSSSSSTKAVPTTTVVYTPPPAPTSTSTSEVYVPPPSSSSPPPAATSSAPPATGTGYMAVVDEWRAKLGLSKLAQDSTLEKNALKTAVDGNGQMVHQLNPGSFGQVLAPGQEDEFYHCFVGGWLCEKPDMAGMNGVCATASEGWYYTSTGHADILTSPNYSKIGCGWAGGIWACDVA
jgi:uncharacterized protein YkwD